jgi:NADH dehydrogenase
MGNHVLVTELADGAAGKQVELPFNEIARLEGFTVIEQKVKGYVARPLEPGSHVEIVEAVVLENGTHVQCNGLIMGVGAAGKPVAPGVYSLRSLQDAQEIRTQVESLFAQRRAAGDTRPVRISIAGAGDTGIELAAALAHEYGDAVRVQLVGKIHLPTAQARYAKARLRALGIKLRSDLHAEDLKSNSLGLRRTSGKTSLLKSDVVIDATGTVGAAANLRRYSASGEVAGEQPLLDNGRIRVDSNLRVLNGPEGLYAIGDCASVDNTRTGRPADQTVHNAEVMGRLAAKNVQRAFAGKRQRSFKSWTYGHIVSLGPNDAVGDIFGIPIKGKLALFLKRAVTRSYHNLKGAGRAPVRYLGLSGLGASNQAGLKALNPLRREAQGQYNRSTVE